ncbi:MAG: erythromycin esterase family protein [Myxococcales bacterium]
MSNPETLSEWLHRKVTLLSDINPEAPLDDLEPLRDIVGDARVVALGEGAHFIEELWTLRQRLVRFLHERMGFNVVAAEFDLREGDALDGWLADPSDPRQLREVSVGAADWGMATTCQWLRSWQATHGRRIRFAGLDAPNGGAAFLATLRPLAGFLREVDPASAPLLDRIERIASALAGTSVARSADAWRELGEAQQDALTAGFARLRQRVHALEHVFAEKSDRARVELARRDLAALECADFALRANDAMHRGAEAPLDMSVRDRFMADRMLELLDREPGSRVVLLAHNGHIQKRPVVWGDYLSAHPLGLYLHRALGEGYRAIGSTTTGDITSEMKLDPAAEVGFLVVAAPLGPPAPGGVEAALVAGGLGGSLALCDLRGAAAAGVAFERIRAQSGYLTLDVTAGYDAVISVPRLTVQRDLGF